MSYWGNLIQSTIIRAFRSRTFAANIRRDVKYRPSFDLLEDRTVPIASPTLLTPTGIVMNPTPIFSWSAVTGAAYYDVQVNDLTTGQTQVLRNTHVTGATWAASASLNFGQSYQWMARAFTSTGVASVWSAPMSFDLTSPFAGSYSGTFTGTTTEGPVNGSVSAEVDAAGNVIVTEPGPGSGTVNLSGGTTMAGTFGFGAVVDAAYAFTGTLVVSTSPTLQIVGTGTWDASWVGGSGTGTWQVAAPAVDLLGTPLDAATPIAPTGATTSTLPTFQWNAVTGADYYEVWVDNVTTGQSRVLQNANVTTTSWTPSTPLTPGQNYQWFVKALDNAGNTSPVSGPTDFKVDFLGTPTLTSPSGAIPDKAPTLTWLPVPGASSYQVWVQDAGTGVSILNKTVTGTSTPTSLTIGHTYDWRVKALSATKNLGFWSAPQSFSIYLAAPSPNAPSGPITNARPALSWSAAANAVSYDVRLDNNTTGLSQLMRVTTLSWTPAKLIPSNSYAWWVRGISANAVVSAWSSEQDFTVTPLAKPTLIAPAGFIQDSTATFTWNTVVGADYYDLMVKDLSAGQAVVLRNQKVLITSLTATTPFVVGHDYQWTVRAFSNNGDFSVWSDASRFTLSNPFAGFYSGTYDGSTTEGSVSGPVEASVGVNGLITVTDPGSGSGSVNFSGGTVITGKGVGVVDTATYKFIGTLTITAGGVAGSGTWTATWPAGGGFPAGSGSGTWTVTSTSVVSNPLDTPTLIAPTGNITAVAPAFTWNAVAGADYYDVWVDDLTAAKTQAFRNAHVTATTWTPPANLVVGHQYQWRVEAYNNAGRSSPWSAYSKFTIVVGAPAPLGPLTGATPGGNPTYTWTAADNANWYDLWVYDSTTNVQVRRNTHVVGTSWTFTGLLTAGKHYTWKVRGVNANGTVGAWSTGQDFTA